MTNLVQCIQIAREEMALRKEAVKELNAVNVHRMSFKEVDLYNDSIVRGTIAMDGETVGVCITVLSTDTSCFDIEIYNLDTGVTHFTDEVSGVDALKSYFKAIDNVLTAKANGVY